MFTGKSAKSLVVTPNSDYCIWVIPSNNLAYDTTVTVDSGCQMLYIVNGQVRERVMNRTVVVNPKQDRRLNQMITLVGVNFEKVFEILCGVGQVPYKDREIGYETVVGANADMKVRVNDGWKLYTMFGNRNVKVDEVNDLVRSKCQEIMSTELSKRLQNATYHTLTKGKMEMSNVLEENIAGVLSDMGLYLVNGTFALGDFFFQPDYKKKRMEYGNQQADNQIESERIKMERQKSRMEMQTLEGMARISAQAAAAQSAPTQGSSAKFCSNCGKEIAAGAKFCPECGVKL